MLVLKLDSRFIETRQSRQCLRHDHRAGGLQFLLTDYGLLDVRDTCISRVMKWNCWAANCPD